jgi:PKD repeat protein
MKKILFTFGLLLLISSKSFAQCDALWSYYIQQPTTVFFMDSSYSMSGPLTYAWDFGDGSPIDNQQFPMHNYGAPGTYNVCLIIDDGMGCADTLCQPVLVVPVPTSVNISYFDVDSGFIFNCVYPQPITFYYSGGAQGYQTNDSLLVEINFDDGTDSTFWYTTGIQQFYGQFVHVYQNPGTYNAQLIVTGPDLLADTVVTQTITISNSCGPVSGTVYNDLNGNCLYDMGEQLGGISLEIYSGTQFMGWSQSNSNGVYSFNVPTGSSYDIHIQSFGGYMAHFVPSCPASGIITANVPSTGNDFGVTCPPAFDLQGHVTGWGFRPGFTGTVCVSAFNQFCNTPNGQIVLTFDSLYTPLPDSLGLYTVNGHTVTFNANGPSYYWNFCVPVSVSTNAILNDSLCVGFSILPVTGDSIPANNTGIFCFPIRNSWDPNDKYGIPEGVAPMGSILPGTDLTYTIRFQNTGTAEAINIYILDSLDADLDAHTIEVIGSSHPMQYSLLAGNILRFNFDNINLPDSNMSEPQSHGYVTYRVKQQANISNMTEITNTAGIYFDFNPAVITNTTLHTIDYFLSVKPINKNSLVKVYPNPANHQCKLVFNDNTKRNVTVADITGKIVFRSSIDFDTYTLVTDKYAEGNYTLQITDTNNSPETFKLVILH